MGLHGPDDLREDHLRRKANKQHADFGLARRYLRVAMCLMRSHQAYLPPHLRRNADTEDLRAYDLEQWPAMRKKWLKAGALGEAFAPENPLGAWRLALQEFYGIRLPQRYSDTRGSPDPVMSRNTSPRQERNRQLPHRIYADPPRRRQEDPEVFAPKTGSEPDAPPTPKIKMKKNFADSLGL